jgi:hypothetical protein
MGVVAKIGNTSLTIICCREQVYYMTDSTASPTHAVTPEAAPECENGMSFLVSIRKRAAYAMDQAFGCCVDRCTPCCRTCSCDPGDIVLCLYIWEWYYD